MVATLLRQVFPAANSKADFDTSVAEIAGLCSNPQQARRVIGYQVLDELQADDGNEGRKIQAAHIGQQAPKGPQYGLGQLLESIEYLPHRGVGIVDDAELNEPA